MDRFKQELDRHITGNYGEDSNPPEPDPRDIAEAEFIRAVDNVADFCTREQLIELLDRQLKAHETMLANLPVNLDAGF